MAKEISTDEDGIKMIETLLPKLRIKELHHDKLKGIGKYVAKHKVQELFNELLVNILTTRPKDVKGTIVNLLKKVNKKISPENKEVIWDFGSNYLEIGDFETLFDTYDVLGVHHIPVSYMVDALAVVGVPEAKQLVEIKYPEILEEGHVNKVTFLYIIEEEHRKSGFAFKLDDNSK
mmetsp:Transcript_15199/g.16915  ORF Transcript_15199/g.16915 Transcript_15199/m.16915 type:complete len:176 (+) Transcript_15199:3-530(+)|eukprot:CAMPEP_0205799192 /NCGR_PEP_ID=MMETSP0205-20121125/375_1 /ASSEMBLY_ACC=CAM_ASM_000278 /TAXON_ID=36767 /ORGANISM="Euplotes focardii, Strain TN1" /LENGTH=175 /DNA_ID=CAMNT_0053060083 /DNA_START=12 /DNA_END=539 /DNA_ORIENTATION=-